MATPAELGYALPVGDDYIRNGDEAIRQNAEVSARLYTEQEQQIAGTAAGVSENAGRLSDVEENAVFDGDNRLLEHAELETDDALVVVDEDDRIILSVPLQSETAAADAALLPDENWAHWGDSMTDDAVTGTGAWVAQLAKATGRKHYNGGWYGQTAAQIAARAGALPPLVTLEGNATKATGASVVSAITVNPTNYSKTRSVRGVLAGVPGSIGMPFDGITMFQPDIPGVFPVPPNSRFIPADGPTYRARTQTIWSGRNDVWTTPPELVVAHIQAMIDYLPPATRVLVFEVPPSSSDGAGGKPLLAAINAAIKAAFPAYWVPIASWLRTDAAAAAAGVTFDANHRQDIANGNTPSVFRSDTVHLNATGCKAVAHRVHLEAKTRGWIA